MNANFLTSAVAPLTIISLSLVLPNRVDAQHTYSLTDLGVIEGRSFSEATGINDQGQVVGSIRGGGIGGSLGFVWDSTTGMTALQGFRSVNDSNSAAGINNLGQIIGTSYRDAGDEHAILWNPDGSSIDLGDLPGGNDSSFGNAINNSGQATGLGIAISGRRAFLWDETNGITDPIGDFAGGVDESRGFAINNLGQVAGYSVSATGPRAFLWDDTNGMTNLGDLAGGDDYSFAYGMNDVGQVVGFGTIDSGRRAFIWDELNGMVDLGTITGGSALESVANAVNDDGVVVGRFQGNQGTFIWEEEYGMIDLHNLLDASGDDWELQDATAINSSGQIVGWGTSPNGVGRAFLLTPNAIPEPGSVSCLALTGLICALRRRRLSRPTRSS